MESDPVASNARNFLLSTPIVLLLPALAPGPVFATSRGVAAALTSGMIASGGGYIVWYRALRGLAVTQAAVAQLSVPVIAAAAAVLLLGEPMNARLVVSGVAVLGGIALVLTSRWLSSGRRLQPGRRSAVR
jgi:drug/metabolite transporter (DMT)-like permease